MFSKSNKSFFKKLSIRLTFGFAILFILSSFFILFLNYYLFQQSLKARDHDLLRAKAKEYSTVFSQGGTQSLKNYLLTEKKSDIETQFLVRVVSSDGSTAFSYLPDKIQNTSPLEFDQKMNLVINSLVVSSFHMKESANQEDPNEDSEYETTNFIMDQNQILQVARNTDDRDDLLERYNRIILLVFGIVLFIGSTGGFIFSNQALFPIRNLIQTIRLIESGNLNARVPVSNSNDEIDEISVLFNQMAEQIEKLILNMQQTLDHVAHDLKTPLTRLRAKAELAILRQSTEIELKSTLSDAIENTNEIVSFINTIMDISEAQAGVLKLNLVDVTSTQILKEVIDLYQYTAEEKEISIQLNEIDSFHFQADRNRCKQVLSNLLDNALKYSAQGSQIKITTESTPFKNQIRFIDSGIGISKENLTRIWDRLFRAESAKNIKGLGLGLSLVHSICKAHNWTIEAKSELHKGSKFILSIKSNPRKI